MRVQCANKECSGLELHRTGSDVSDNAGVYVATLQVQLSRCCGRNRLEQLRKHPAAGGSRKKWTASARFFARKICEKKMPSFPQKYGFESARKNLRPFSQIFGPGPFAGSLSQNLTPGDVFFSLTAVSVELAMLSECVPSLSTKCAL